MPVQKILRAIGATVGLMLFAAAGHATPAPGLVNVRPTGFSGLALGNNYYKVVAGEFRADVGLTVSSLGVYDDDLLVSGSLGEPDNGLAELHTLLIWNSSGTELARVDIGPGADAPEIEGFRYADIAPIHFDAGESFTVGATYVADNLDNYYVGVSPPYYAPDDDLTYLGLHYRLNGVPTTSYPAPLSGALYIAANFLFEADEESVPEPAGLAIFGLGLAAVGWLRRRVSSP